MDENQEILELLQKLNKKVDRLTNTVTKIAKVLHLMPVTEKEERELQLLQRDLDEMSPKDETLDNSTLQGIYSSDTASVFGDVVADDFLTGGE